MDWSLLHTLNDFLFRHDRVEDPLLFYVNASEMLFVATLAVVFLLAHGRRHLDWRRATVAAVLSAGLGLAVAKVLSERSTGLVRSSPTRTGFTCSPATPPTPASPATTRRRRSRSRRRSSFASGGPDSSPSAPRRCSPSAGSRSAFTIRAMSWRALRWAARRPWLSGSPRPAAERTPSPTFSADGGTGPWAGAPTGPESPGAPEPACRRDH